MNEHFYDSKSRINWDNMHLDEQLASRYYLVEDNTWGCKLFHLKEE
jgi:hypothetical protein